MNRLDDIPSQQRRILDMVKEVALEKGCHPYLVGGPVRDILLRRPVADVDLTLEEGGSTLARALARKVQGRVRSFPQFLTYKVTAPGFPAIDIATSRKERYRQPGALPAVTSGKLKDDLLRRDFTINAMALDLLDGTMHDPAGGERDLEARAVRVLHEKSFVDDPTRIFRAIRLAARLGFAIETKTDDLMTRAMTSGSLKTVSRERIWRELFLAMDEQEAPGILATLSSRGALKVLFGPRPGAELEARLAAVAGQVREAPEADRYVLFAGELLRGDASPVDFEGSGFSQKRARAVVEIANELPVLLDSLSDDREEHERFAIYRKVSPETLIALVAERPSEQQHVSRFREFDTFRLPLRGNDLEVPLGPHIARALEQTRAAVFSGEIPAEEARSYAREIARRLMSES